MAVTAICDEIHRLHRRGAAYAALHLGDGSAAELGEEWTAVRDASKRALQGLEEAGIFVEALFICSFPYFFVCHALCLTFPPGISQRSEDPLSLAAIAFEW